ncbi:MAG: histidinol-phosphate transaminase [Elusimicrobia bacterium]|nr:histidinol-phosphate transaminase [Elusimicrobiota bacterium]
MFETLVRSCLHQVSPYHPGKPIGEVQRELGIKKVVKLASNENPLGASPRAVRLIRRLAASSFIYPEGASPLLRQALAKHLGVDVSRVIIGNGSDELIRLLCEAFLDPGDEAVVSRFGFIRFAQHARLMGAKVVEVPMEHWRHDLSAMAGAVTAKTKILFVASPNNPTGTYNTAQEVGMLLNTVPSRVLVVLDEAYYHYARLRPDYPESLKEMAQAHSNLVVMRTFSKAYGLAGVRVGYAVAATELIQWLDRIRMPFNVSLLGQLAAEEALQDAAFVRRSVALVEKEKEKLYPILQKWGLKVTPSAANFLFVESRILGKEVFQRLLYEGVIVRPLDEYGLHHHLRISVGTPQQNRILLRALSKVLGTRF